MSNRDILQFIISMMAHELRARRHESYYMTSKVSGLRMETIKKIEAYKGGSFSSIGRYMTSFCRRYPSVGYSVMYNAGLESAQQRLFDDDTEAKL